MGKIGAVMKMKKQQSIADIEYANRKRKTKRDEFLGITRWR